jgi:hypothetical protein
MNPKKFECINCDFKCFKKADYTRHLSTRKHKKGCKIGDFVTDLSVLVTEFDEKSAFYISALCSKKYKSRNGLWLHKKAVIQINKSKKQIK